MPNPGAFSGGRLFLLNSFLEGYRQAIEDGGELEFLANVVRVYHSIYPETMNENEGPTEAQVEALLSNLIMEQVEDPVFMLPVQKPGQSDADFEEEMRAYEELKKRYAFRADQIFRWFNYRRLARTPPRREPDALERLLGKLAGVTSSGRRKLPDYTVWARANAEEVEPLVKKQVEELQGQQAVGKAQAAEAGNGSGAAGGPSGGNGTLGPLDGKGKVEGGQDKKGKGKFVKKGKGAYVAVRQEVIRNAFETLPESDRKKWAEKARSEAQQREAAYRAAIFSPPPTDPASRQSAIERTPGFLQPILEGLSAATGWCFTIVGGGPEPADGGRLNIIASHSGVTGGTVPLNFGAAYRQYYKTHWIPGYAHFLQRVYSVEECRKRALPTEGPTLASIINEESDGVSHDRIVLPPKLPQGVNLSKLGQKPSDSTPNPFKPPATSSCSSTMPAAGSSSMASSNQSNQEANKSSNALNPGRKSQVARMTTGGRAPPIPAPRMSTGGKGLSSGVKPSQPPAQSQKDRPARYRLAGSSRAQEEGCGEKPATTSRPRSASLPPSPSKNGRSSSMSTVPTPPRDTQSPRALSPATVPSSQSPPFLWRSTLPSPPPQAPDDASMNIDFDTSAPRVTKTYRSPSKKKGGKRTRSSMAVDLDAVNASSKSDENDSDSASLHAEEQPSKRQKRGCNESISAPANVRQGKKRRVGSSTSAPVGRRGAGSEQQNSVSSSSTQPAALDVPTPPGCPEYVIRVLMLCREVGLDIDFRRMLRLYLKIDGAAGFAGRGRLTSDCRPDGLQAWINRARSHTYRPDTSDLSVYYEEFFEWFKQCMPVWRKDQRKGIRLTRDPNGDWEPLRLTGSNGIVSLVAALAWWKEALDRLPRETQRQKQMFTCRRAEYEGALDEVIYCFEGLAKNL
ncbi:SERTA domain-containing protein 3 [Paramarasmius palmivorus]|uniref:SERTA domain-containing protein 3 n=1 Tax=Paramarasmius palmivorus TaxID=297713 RepID=A0AAW0B126_9AGAR